MSLIEVDLKSIGLNSANFAFDAWKVAMVAWLVRNRDITELGCNLRHDLGSDLVDEVFLDSGNQARVDTVNTQHNKREKNNTEFHILL